MDLDTGRHGDGVVKTTRLVRCGHTLCAQGETAAWPSADQPVSDITPEPVPRGLDGYSMEPVPRGLDGALDGADICCFCLPGTLPPQSSLEECPSPFLFI